MSERVLPSTLDYADVLPKAVPAVATRRRFFPQNGNAFSDFTSRTIRIEVGSSSQLLDPTNSYLDFELSNGSAQTLGLDISGAHTFFENVRIEQAGRVISDLQQHNRLHAAVLAPAQETSDGFSSQGIKGCQRAYTTAAAASNTQAGTAAVVAGNLGDTYSNSRHNATGRIAAGAGIRFSMSLTNGLFGQDKLIPLPMVRPDAPITIVLDVANAFDYGSWNGAPANGSVVITNISYVAHLVEVGEDVLNQFRMVQQELGGQLVISGQDYEYSADLLPAASPSGEHIIRMPARKRSLNSLFWVAQSGDLANTLGPLANALTLYTLSYSGQPNLESWNIRVGSVLYPTEPVQGFGDTTAATPAAQLRRGQCVMELAKAFGTLGFTTPTGFLSGITYGTDMAAAGGCGNGDNGTAGATVAPASNEKICVCPHGLSLQAFAREARESGIDTETLSQDTYLQLTVAEGATSGEAKTIHMWVVFDQHYYFNDDGNITFTN